MATAGDGAAVLRHLLVLLLLAAACASPERRRSWDDIDLGPRASRVVADGPRALAPLDPATATAVLPASDRPPRPDAYGAPAGGRLLAHFEGPAAPLPARDLALPEPLWVPALPPSVAGAIERGALAPELAVDGFAEADVDGDGVDELVVLARPRALFEREGPERFALLLALERVPGGHRLQGWARFSPRRHAAPGGPARWCHASFRLAGFLRRGERQVAVVWEEQGVACAQLVGGGFDRLLHVAPLDGGGQSIVVSGARLRAEGAADLYDGAGWAADVDGDGAEELVVRGVASEARQCRGGGEASWTEELAARVVGPAGIRAVREGRALDLPDGVLPAGLLRRHPAACGTAAGPPR